MYTYVRNLLFEASVYLKIKHVNYDRGSTLIVECENTGYLGKYDHCHREHQL